MPTAALKRAERAVMDALFSVGGRDDPHAALRGASIPGCRYGFVRDVLHDPRLVAPDVPPSGHPREDLLSLLAASRAEVAREDLLANCIFFVLAGHATTTTLLAAGVLLLAEHRDQTDRLLADRAGWPPAIEELLRHICPITLTGAKAVADVEVDGYRFTAGQQRTLAYAAANRDPRVFTDPDRFDVTRAPNPHLAFAAGAHYCLGAPLARLHAEIALPALFTRLPGLRLAGPPQWRGSTPVRQIE